MVWCWPPGADRLLRGQGRYVPRRCFPPSTGAGGALLPHRYLPQVAVLFSREALAKSWCYGVMVWCSPTATWRPEEKPLCASPSHAPSGPHAPSTLAVRRDCDAAHDGRLVEYRVELSQRVVDARCVCPHPETGPCGRQWSSCGQTSTHIFSTAASSLSPSHMRVAAAFSHTRARGSRAIEWYDDEPEGGSASRRCGEEPRRAAQLEDRRVSEGRRRAAAAGGWAAT